VQIQNVLDTTYDTPQSIALAKTAAASPQTGWVARVSRLISRAGCQPRGAKQAGGGFDADLHWWAELLACHIAEQTGSELAGDGIAVQVTIEVRLEPGAGSASVQRVVTDCWSSRAATGELNLPGRISRQNAGELFLFAF